MIDYILGGIIIGLMVYAAIKLIKKVKNQSCVCGGNCSSCSSKHHAVENESGKHIC